MQQTVSSAMDADIRRCLQEEAPYCQAACPFGLNTPDFLEKLARGSFDFAYKAYRNAVGFPEIVARLCPAPCQKACSLREAAGAVALPQLEQAVCAYAKRKEPTDYNIPAKQQRIAIVGAGLSGLAALLRLAEKKYPVSLFEQEAEIGGALRGHPQFALFLADIERQLQFIEYDLQLKRRIADLSELDGFDAVYLATGLDGADFGQKTMPRPGIFLGGGLRGGGPMQAIADGLAIVNPIEWWLKTQTVKELPAPAATRLQIDKRLFHQQPPISGTLAEGALTKEEAQAEAGRCLHCSCQFCRQDCDLLALHRKAPKRLKDEIETTVYPKNVDGQGHSFARLMASCLHCERCAAGCPEGIDFADFIQTGRRVMEEKGSFPWAFSDYWLRDFAHARGERAALALTPPGGQVRAVYFPGCQLGASLPDYVLHSYAHLLAAEPATALLLDCCGQPAHWAAQTELQQQHQDKLRQIWRDWGQPTFILTCPNCHKFFRQFLPQIELQFYYQLPSVQALPLPPQAEPLAVFDPCASRGQAALQADIRNHCQANGYQLIPLKSAGEEARCCSFGGQVAVANPAYAAEIIKRRAAEAAHPYLTYCSNCRDNFASQGKPAWHFFDLLFDLGRAERPAPLKSARRANREALKAELLARYQPEAAAPAMPAAFPLQISPALQQQLSDEYLLEEEIRAVIAHCEQSGRRIYDPAAECYIGHQKIGRITYWVHYRPLAEGFALLDAYSHRMNIEGE